MNGRFKLAVRNLICYKSITIKIVIAFTALISLIALFSAFIMSTDDKQAEMKRQYVSSNYIISEEVLSPSDINNSEFAFSADYIDFEPISGSLPGLDFSFLPMHRISLQIGERTYNSTNSSQGVFIYALSEQNALVTKNDFGEIGASDAEYFIEGKLPENANEIALAEYMLEEYGIQDPPIGKKLSAFSVANGNAVWEDLTVCGIIKNTYYELSGHSDGMIQFAPSIIIHNTNNMLAVYPHTQIYIYTLSQWPDLNDSTIYQNNVRYVGSGYLEEIQMLNNVEKIISQIFLYVGSALIFGIVLISALLIDRLINSLLANNGILMAIGSTESFLVSLWLIQISIIIFASFVLATALTAIIFIAINNLILSSFGIIYQFELVYLGLLFGIAAALLCLTLFFTLLILFFDLRKNSIRALIDCSKYIAEK